MTAYGTVAAVRIQQWLVRTPALKFMRGASKALRHDNLKTKAGAFVAGAKWEPIEVDGVLGISAANKAEAVALCARIVDALREYLPAVEWLTWVVEADSYAEARDLAARHDEAVVFARALPAVADFPGLPDCHACRAEPSGVRLVDGESVGADCAARYERSKREGDVPENFDELARRGVREAETAPRRGTVLNAMATIVADGNQVGHTFEQLAACEPDPRQACAGMLDKATKLALAVAGDSVDAIARGQGAATPAWICHYVGGDDVFVSVPAPLAWKFVDELMRNFGIELDREANGVSIKDSVHPDGRTAATVLKQISLSVGVCFADDHYPVSDTHRRAEAALSQAKRRVNGAVASVSWLNLTRESQLPASRYLRSADLSGLSSGWPAEVLALPPSAHAQLYRYVSARDHDPQRLDKIIKWAERVDHRKLAEYLEGNAPSDAQLESVLALDPWWRA